MSNELTLNLSLAFAKDSASISVTLSDSIDVGGDSFMHHKQEIDHAAEVDVDMGDVGAQGYFLAINRDATNFIEIRPAAGIADMVKLSPGEFCLMRLAAAVNIKAQADTAPCDMEYWAFDP